MRANTFIPALTCCAIISTTFVPLHAEEQSPQEATVGAEVEKIDARIKELQLILKQEDQIIRQLTKNRTVPVQQGTQAYYTCLNSSNRYKAAETEIQSETQKRTEALERQKKLAQQAAEQLAKNEEKTKEAQRLQAEEKAKNDKISTLVIPAISYEKAVHGPKIKGLFIGMNMKDFQAKVKELTGNEPSIDQNKDNGFNLAPLKSTTTSGGHLGNFDGILATADSNGLIKSFIISSASSKKLFKAEDLKFEEFKSLFEKSYGVPFDAKPFDKKEDPDTLFSIELNAEFSLGSDEGKYLRTITPEGVLVRLRENFSIECVKTAAPKEVEKAFD